jgi:histidinol-phosphate phosphatase family protein
MAGVGGRAVFLDRDGTLIEDVGYPRDPDQVLFLDGAIEALRALRDSGFRLVVVSNQSGIGRGLITPAEAAAVHERFAAELAAAGVVLDDSGYCPHAPGDGCACRKPQPGLLLDAARRLDLDLTASFMVGDKDSDVGAGRRAGTHTVRFQPGQPGRSAWEQCTADRLARSWPEVLEAILGRRVAA